MKLRPERREAPEINLTPLIDVVFLLLIFFMVSTTFERSKEFGIELPSAVQGEDPKEQEIIEIAVDAPELLSPAMGAFLRFDCGKKGSPGTGSRLP